MAYTFQSRATGELIMLKATAEQILKLLDKQAGEPGIVTVEQIPHALEVLEKAVAEDDAKRKEIEREMQSASSEDVAKAASASALLGSVSLRQRIVPFADMLRRSLAEDKPVTWQV